MSYFPPEVKTHLQRKIRLALVECHVPSSLHGGLERYLLDGVPTGGFLEAVIDNDLKEAVGRADHINVNHIQDVVRFLYDAAPMGSWGRAGAFAAWCTAHLTATVTEPT